jgi:hypothetical protein
MVVFARYSRMRPVYPPEGAKSVIHHTGSPGRQAPESRRRTLADDTELRPASAVATAPPAGNSQGSSSHYRRKRPDIIACRVTQVPCVPRQAARLTQQHNTILQLYDATAHHTTPACCDPSHWTPRPERVMRRRRAVWTRSTCVSIGRVITGISHAMSVSVVSVGKPGAASHGLQRCARVAIDCQTVGRHRVRICGVTVLPVEDFYSPSHPWVSTVLIDAGRHR